MHQPVQQDDLDVLDWVLDRTPAEVVTLETEDMPRDMLCDQIELMRKFLARR
jgi:hypothetical protein